jgi:cyclopropane-fatty-acyl-phospholipid synthase
MIVNYQEILSALLAKAGITLNGSNPWDIQIHHPDTCKRILRDSNLGLGESYMDGWWDCQAIDQMSDRMLRAQLEREVLSFKNVSAFVLAKLSNLQSQQRAAQVCEQHYDLGNDLFQKMLDPRMVYTCGFWPQAQTLAEAQTAKLELICQKLQLKPGMRLLDIGCGWGSLMKYAAEHYGVQAVGYTLSQPQVELGRQLCHHLPVEFILDDYRKIHGQFDRVVSVGMFEAVGYKNFRTFMQIAEQSLAHNGLFLLHTMGGNRSFYASDPWYHRYIFPNGMIPSLAQLGKACENRFVIEDVHNFGPDYDLTLMAWYTNFQAAWPELSLRYSPRFKRMWDFYLLQVAGAFRSRSQQLWQLLLSKPGTPQYFRRQI